MRNNFQKSLQFTLNAEGVKSYDKAGGETKYGIAHKMHPEIGAEEWAQFTQGDAILLYERDYWEAMGCDDFPAPYDSYAFDCAVNIGVSWTKSAIREYGIEKLNDARRQHYKERAAEVPELAQYDKGWMARVDRLEKTFPVKEVTTNVNPISIAVAGYKMLSPLHDSEDAYQEAKKSPDATLPAFLNAKFLGSVITLVTAFIAGFGTQLPPSMVKAIQDILTLLQQIDLDEVCKVLGVIWGIGLVISGYVFKWHKKEVGIAVASVTREPTAENVEDLKKNLTEAQS